MTEENNIQTASASEGLEAHTTEGETTSGGVLGTLGIHGDQIIAQFINFSFVLLVVWFLILKPLTKKLEERRIIIDESLDRAKEIEGKLVVANAMYDDKLREATAAADAVIARSHDEAKQLTEQMKQDTKNEIAGLVAAAKEKIQAQKNETINEICAQTAEIAIAIAEKIIGEKLDVKKDQTYITDSLAKMK